MRWQRGVVLDSGLICVLLPASRSRRMLRVAALQAAFLLGAGFYQGGALRFRMSARWA